MAALVGVISKVFASGFLKSVLGRILISVALGAVQTILAKARADRIAAANRGIRGEKTLSGSKNPMGFILGRYATGGVHVVTPYTSGTNNNYMTYVIMLGCRRGATLTKMIVSGEVVQLDTTTDATYGRNVLGKYAGKMWVKFRNGTEPAADTFLTSTFGSHPDRPWTSDMIGRDAPHAIVTFLYDDELYNQYPEVRFEVTDTPLYDIRKDTTAGGSGAHRWSDPTTWEPTTNPVVMIYNILRGIPIAGVGTWGGEAEAEDFRFTEWAAAMNKAQGRYQAGFEVYLSDKPDAVISELLKACSGQIADVGGTWRVSVGAPDAAVYYFSDEDLIVSENTQFDPFPGVEDTTNTVVATFVNPEALWEVSEAITTTNADFIATDDARILETDLSLSAVFDSVQAQDLATTMLADNRRFRSHITTLPLSAMFVEPLDTVGWTSEYNGYNAKLFEIGQCSADVIGCIPTVTSRERDPNDYDFAGGVPYVPVSTVTTPIPTVVDGFTVTGHIITDGSSNRRPALRITWGAGSMGFARSIRYRVRLTASPTTMTNEGAHADPSSGVLIISEGILPAVSYQVSVKVVARGRSNPWSSWITVVSPDVRFSAEDFDLATTPATPTGLALSSALTSTGGVRLTATWTAVAGTDIRYDIRLRQNGGNDVVFSTSTNRYEWDVLPNTNYVAAVRAVGRLLVTSVYSAEVSHTTTKDSVAPAVPTGLTVTGGFETLWLKWNDVSDVDLDFYEVFESATSTPAPTAGSTPTYTTAANTLVLTGLADGVTKHFWVRSVDTSNNKSAWTARAQGTTVALVAADVSGILQEASYSVNLVPPVVVATLPTTGNFQGRLALLTTDNKLYRYTGTAWTTAVPAVDITGQVVASQIADAAITTAKFASGIEPVEIVATLPTTGNFAGRIAFLTTDNKLYRHTGTAWTTAVPAVDITGQVVASQIADAAITTAKFASGIEPVEIVATLPTTGNFQGRIALLTTDNKLYRYTGSAWTAAVPAADVTGQITGTQIADAAITTAKFASGIEPVEIVATLPTTGNFAGRIAFLTTDNTLSRHTGTAWTAAVPAVDITGQLAAAQIASLEASKITGQLTDAQISDLSAAKMTGQITGTQITDNAISAPKIAAGAVIAGKIAADAVTAGTIAANAVTAAKIAAGAVEAAKIAAGAVEADKIAANAVTADKIAANAITAGKIATDAVTAGTIAAGAVNAREIAANAITTGQMAVRSFNNLIENPDFENGAIHWTNSSKIVNDPVNALRGSWVFTHVLTSSANTLVSRSNYVEALPGDSFYMRGSFKNSAGSTGNFYLQARFYSDSGAVITVTNITWSGENTSWSEKEMIVTAPANAVRMTVNLYTAGVGTAYWDGISLMKAAEGKLIVDGSIIAAKIAAGAVEADKIAANAVTATTIAADAVTAGKVAAGAINAREIAAGAITTTKLSIGDTSNMVPNDWSTGNLDGWNVTFNDEFVLDTGLGSAAGWRLKTRSRDVTPSSYAAVSEGEQYYLSAWVYNTDTTRAQLMLHLQTQNGATNTYPVAAFTDTKNAWVLLEGTVSVPATYTRAKVILQTNRTDGVGTFTFWTKPVMRRAAAGKLIVDGTITADKIAANAVTADKIAANAITAGKIATDAVTAGTIAAGAINAREIAAGAITASKIVVTDFQNIIPNGDFSSGSEGWARMIGSVAFIDSASGPSRYAAVLTRTTTENSLTSFANFNSVGDDAGVAVNAGDQFHLEYWAFSTVAGSNYHNMVVRQPGGSLSVVNFTAATLPLNTWTKVSATATATVSGKLFLRLMNSISNSTLYISNVRLLRRNGAELIVDGTITADKIAANAVTADKIAANAITAGKIDTDAVTAGTIAAGAITAREIAAQTIVASKMAVTDLTNLVLNNTLDTSEGWTLEASIAVANAPAGMIRPRALEIGAVTITRFARYTAAVDAGAEYVLSCQAAGTAGGKFTVRLGVIFRDAAGVQLTNPGATVATLTDATPVNVSDDFTAPAGAVTAEFRFGRTASGSEVGLGYIVNPTVRRKNGGELIVDGAITATKVGTNEIIAVAANIKDAVITDAKIADLSAAKLTAGTALAASITVNAKALSTIKTEAETGAQDPVTRINAGTTQIDPGKIVISGATTLSDWRMGGDLTKINGGSISANTVSANKLTIGSRGVTAGIEFEHNSPAANSVSWTAGAIRYINDAGTSTTTNVTAGNAAWTSGVLYIYWTKGATTLSTTTTQATALGADNVILATYSGGVNLVGNYGRTVIDGSNIKTGTITSSQLTTTSAVITGTAQIANAIITGAKIGNLEVDTLQIANNAVTIPVNSYAAASVNVPSTTTETTVATLTISRAAGYATRLGFSALGAASSTTATAVNYTLYRGTTSLFTFSSTHFAVNSDPNTLTPVSMVFWDNDTAGGSTTYSIKATRALAGVDANMSKRSFEAQQFKR